MSTMSMTNRRHRRSAAKAGAGAAIWRDQVRVGPDEPAPPAGWAHAILALWAGPAAGESVMVAWRGAHVVSWRPPQHHWAPTRAHAGMGAHRLAARLLHSVLDERDRLLAEWDKEEAALESLLAAEPPESVRDRALALRHRLLAARRGLDLERRTVSRRWTEAGEHADPLEVACWERVSAQQQRLDSARELVGGVLDAYFSGVSARLNEIVKTLTAVTTVMLPASLVAALYGMNFRYLPGAEAPYGFWMVVGTVAALAATLLAIFRRRGWI